MGVLPWCKNKACGRLSSRVTNSRQKVPMISFIILCKVHVAFFSPNSMTESILTVWYGESCVFSGIKMQQNLWISTFHIYCRIFFSFGWLSLSFVDFSVCSFVQKLDKDLWIAGPDYSFNWLIFVALGPIPCDRWHIKRFRSQIFIFHDNALKF